MSNVNPNKYIGRWIVEDVQEPVAADPSGLHPVAGAQTPDQKTSIFSIKLVLEKIDDVEWTPTVVTLTPVIPLDQEPNFDLKGFVELDGVLHRVMIGKAPANKISIQVDPLGGGPIGGGTAKAGRG